LWVPAASIAGLAALVNLPPDANQPAGDRSVMVAGIQAEFPPENHVPGLLDKALAAFPNAELLVLSEYTF
jgi:hypothetical protein